VSVPQTLTIAAAQPAIFTTNQQGTGQGAIVNGVTNVLADSNHPVHSGDFVSIYCTGLGAVSPAVAEGQLAPTTVLTPTVAPVTVTIGGNNAMVNFAGLAPGFAGLNQVNAVVPDDAPTGDNVVVVMTTLQQISPPGTIRSEIVAIDRSALGDDTGRRLPSAGSLETTPRPLIPHPALERSHLSNVLTERVGARSPRYVISLVVRVFG
jgi:hypothetical protein